MLAWWTELLPVFLFKLAARRCGTYNWDGVAWHDARPGIAVQSEESIREVRIQRVAAHARECGILSAETKYKHFGKRIVAAGIRRAFLHGPTPHALAKDGGL